jgi:hypothetical protein
MVLMTGLRWGAVAAAVALVLGIILTAKHPSGSGATIALVAVMPIGLGIITASYRWGAIAGMMGGGLHAIDKIATAIAEIYLFPLRIMSWIVGAAYGSALRSPEAARAIAGLMNRLFVLNVRLVLFLLGFCLCVLAGAPYAVYMIITKRTMVRAWGFVGLITVGLLFEIAGWSGFFALMEHGRGGEGPSGGSLTETTVPVRPDQQGVKGNTQRAASRRRNGHPATFSAAALPR